MEIFNVKLNDTSIRIIFCKTLSAFRTENTIVMLKGKAVSNGKPVSTEEIARVVEEKGVSEVIENLDGVFCILIYHFNDLLIGKSIQSGPALFYCKKNMDIFVSDKISDIKFLNPDMTFSLNIKMAEHYLSGNRIATQESLITGIYKVNNGEFIKFNNQLKPVLLRDEFSITKKNNSTIDSIIDNIEMMRDNRKIALLFSGGLDSALIFHTLKESGNKFCAYHFFSDESDDSEKYFAKEYCSKYGVDFISVNKKINFNEKLYFNLNPNSPDEIPLIFEQTDEEGEGQPPIDDDLLYLCGHGGDHIFGQNPSELFGIDAYRSHGLMFMHKKIVEFSNLKGKRYKDIIFSNISAFINTSNGCSPAKQEHVSDMKLASAQFFATDYTGKINKLTPFLHKNIIQHYAGLPVFSLFNQHFDRYPVRYEAFQRFGSDIFWKKNKRSSSQLIFRILSGKKDELVNTIKQSGLIEILGINHIELESILYENTTTRLTMELPYILNLYRLAKFIQLQSIDYKG